MTLRRRTLLSLPLATAFAGTAFTQGTAFAQGSDWEKVVEKANSQGRLNILHNTPPPGGDLWFAAFTKAYPKISVEATRLGSSELMPRFATEYGAGASRSDAVITLWDDTLSKWEDDGWIRTFVPPQAAALPAQFKRNDRVYSLQLMRSCLVSNKVRIHEADAPKEWTDFFAPKWKGKIGMDPPWRSVAVQEMLALWDSLGMKDVPQRLKANGVKFFNGSAGVIQATIRGDIQVAAVIDSPVISALKDDAPIRAAYPKSGVPAISVSGFLPAKSPHPEVGMVFMNWAMSAEGQQAFQDAAGAPVVRPGIKPPKYVPGIEGMKIVLSTDLLTPAKQKAIVTEWRQVFGLQ